MKDPMTHTMKASCYDLILEVTRRCNMGCEHCLRGDAEDLDMPDELIENIFAGISETTVLTFTGGEPALAVKKLRTALDLAKKYGTRVREAYIVTNGKEITEEFLAVCRDWNSYCILSHVPEEIRSGDGYVTHHDARRIIDACSGRDERMGCYVELSMDPYHENVPLENVLKITSLPHTNADKYNETAGEWELYEGRAAFNGIGDPDLPKQRPWAYGPDAAKPDVQEIKDGVYIELLYVNAEGGILKYCDYSYESQEEHLAGKITGPGWVRELKSRYLEEREGKAMEMGTVLYVVQPAGQDRVYLKFWDSDNEAATEGCDSCIGYSVYDCNTEREIDGGEMDYDSESKNWASIRDAVEDVMDFALDGAEIDWYEESERDPDDFE